MIFDRLSDGQLQILHASQPNMVLDKGVRAVRNTNLGLAKAYLSLCSDLM